MKTKKPAVIYNLLIQLAAVGLRFDLCMHCVKCETFKILKWNNFAFYRNENWQRSATNPITKSWMTEEKEREKKTKKWDTGNGQKNKSNQINISGKTEISFSVQICIRCSTYIHISICEPIVLMCTHCTHCACASVYAWK